MCLTHCAVAHVQVILLTDADVDGAHIRTLLLTFLFRYARDLFEKGHIYVGVPPLYKLERGRAAAEYLYNEAELGRRTQGLAQGSYNVQRFKVILLTSDFGTGSARAAMRFGLGL